MANFIETFFPEHFSRADRRGVIFAFIFAIIFFIALINARPPTNYRVKKPIALIESFSNDVRLKEAGSVSFFGALKNEILQNRDEVFTGENSVATIHFIKSKTKLKIPSSSLITIEDGENGETIEIKEGLVDIILAKEHSLNVKVNGVDHKIMPVKKESAVKAFYTSGELHLFTKSADVKIESEKVEFKLEANRDATVIKDEIKVDTTFMLLSPAPGDVIEDAEGINISTNIKAKYKITVANNANFSHPLYTQEFENTNSKLETKLEEGDYFLKVEDGKASKIVPITYSSKNKILENIPEDGELLKLKPGEGLDLKWGARPVKSYKVYVKDSSGKETTYITHTNSLHLDHVTGATLDWKVVPEITSGKYSSISNAIKNTLAFQGKLDFINPPTKTKFNTHDEKIFLTWNGHPQEQFLLKVINLKNMNIIFEKKIASNKIWVPVEVNGNNRIEVSTLDYPGVQKAEFSFEVNTPILAWDANMISEIKSPESDEEVNLKYKENIALNKNSNLHINFKSVDGDTNEREIKFGNKESVKLDGFGQYCFYATLKNPVDFYTNSKEFCMKLVQIPVFGPLPKAADTILVAIKRGKNTAYKISVPKIMKAAKYLFEIYSDKEGKNLVFAKEETLPEMYWVTKGSGVYFLRYKVLDIKKRESGFSPFSKFIFPISPLEDW